jgi:AraC family transcriptional regulator of adaptative response/methylated-DNA-[protein]-cysteine methyltransferase
MNDFERVAAVIRHLDEHHTAQPALGDLAAAAGLSESHLHRLFKRWAGVTPKDFLQCLTAEHAKRRLRESASVLEATLDAGLSGPGRLHDLLVTIEAASPGEFKSGGLGMTIEWGETASPFGMCNIGWTSRGICHLTFEDIGDPIHETREDKFPLPMSRQKISSPSPQPSPPSIPQGARGKTFGSVGSGVQCANLDSRNSLSVPLAMRENWPNATFRRDDREAQRRARLIFYPAEALGHNASPSSHPSPPLGEKDGMRGSSAGPGSHAAFISLRAFVRATPFQLKVWRALLRVPEGCVASYGAIAGSIGQPLAARAVGTACGANAIAYLIPCHRVIRETGVVNGYRWGDARKRAMLAWESVR